MSKNTLISVCLCVLLCIAGVSIFAIKDYRLTTWDIKYARLSTAESELCSMAIIGDSDSQFLYHLAKPGTRRVIAVVDYRKDGSFVFNPRYPITKKLLLDYGPIPKTSNFTFSDAEKIFGDAKTAKYISSKEKKVSYKLIALLPKKMDSDEIEVNLDLIFFNQKLYKYRIQTKKIEEPKWTIVSDRN